MTYQQLFGLKKNFICAILKIAKKCDWRDKNKNVCLLADRKTNMFKALNAMSFQKKRAVISEKGSVQPLFALFTAFFVAIIWFGVLPVQASVGGASGLPVKNTVFLNLKSGESSIYRLTYKNTGKITWKKDKVFLETGDFLKSFSKLQSVNWLKFYRATGIGADVKPGESVSINLPITAPGDINGDIQQNFQLVENGDQPITGTTMRLFVNIQPAVSVFVARAAVPVRTVAPARSVSTAAASIIQSSTPAIVKINSTSFSCSATGMMTSEQISQYANCNTAIKENDATNGQSVITSADHLEPILRIGLFSTTLAQRVVQASIADVKAEAEPLFSGVTAGEIVTLGFDFNSSQYSATVAGMTKYSQKPIRIIPRIPNSPATLVDYRTTPTGSGTAADNRFRNIIEMQYSLKTGRLWLINELPLGYYLKGLGETSNASPVEFQKVMLSAARTYAMYHYNRGIDYKIKDGSTKHADEHFHLDSTYDQVYRGYSSELRTPTLVQAENETSGLVITYQGKIIVTPYFSRSDGRTRSWTEVWGGAGMPWLQSVSVPQDSGQALWGHGVGMSARGALLMVANDKKSWDTVIKYFYQGVGISRLY